MSEKHCKRKCEVIMSNVFRVDNDIADTIKACVDFGKESLFTGCFDTQEGNVR